MPILKAVGNGYGASYKTGRDLRNLVNYAVYGKDGSENVCGAQGLILANAESMFQEMEAVKKYFHKEKNRQALHYVLSFSKEEEEYIGIQEALQIGYGVAAFFMGWQVVFGIHTNTDNLHIHFIVNCTSYEDGRAYGMGEAQLEGMQEQINIMVWNARVSHLPEDEHNDAVFKQIKKGAPYERD